MRRGRRARRICLVAAAALALAVAACASPAPSATAPPTTPPPSATAPPTAPEPATPAPSTTAGVQTSSPNGPSPAGGAVEDPALLDILPATVDGVPVTLEHQAFVDAVRDPAFAQNVRRAAFGVAGSGSDLASGVVAELRPGLFSDAFFRDWRDTYDEGACRQAGGVVGNAEAQLGERTVYITTCAAGLRTYHAWLPGRGTIVSAFALGDRRLGEALMDGLRP